MDEKREFAKEMAAIWGPEFVADSDLLALVRNAATQYGRCCDLYQDGFGGFHCHEDGQRTFQMLREVQSLLGFDKVGGKTTDEERAASVVRAKLNRHAPKLLEALETARDELLAHGKWLDASGIEREASFRGALFAIEKALEP